MKKKTKATMNNIRYLVFREGKTWYAVALELHIVESGQDPQAALFELFEAVTGYLKVVARNKKKPMLPPPDAEYESLWKKAVSARQLTASPYHIFAFGERAVSY